MNCRKCGVELHEDQKVCIACGARTAAGGDFHVEEQKRWKPSRPTIIGAAALVAVVIIALIVSSLRTIAPDAVAKRWFDALSDRKVEVARDYVTPQFEQQISARGWDMRALSDDFFYAINDDRGKAVFGEAVPEPTDPNAATVTIKLTYPDNQKAPDEVMVKLRKADGKWLITEMISTI